MHWSMQRVLASALLVQRCSCFRKTTELCVSALHYVCLHYSSSKSTCLYILDVHR